MEEKLYKEIEWLGRKVRFIEGYSATLDVGAVRTITYVDEQDSLMPFKVGYESDQDPNDIWVSVDMIEPYVEEKDDGSTIDILIRTDGLSIHRGKVTGRIHIYDRAGHVMVDNSQLEDLITVLQYAKLLNDQDGDRS